MTIAVEKNPPVRLPNEPTITPQIVAEHGLAPGTLFADIPDDWRCPECGVGKDDFYLLDFVI